MCNDILGMRNDIFNSELHTGEEVLIFLTVNHILGSRFDILTVSNILGSRFDIFNSEQHTGEEVLYF